MAEASANTTNRVYISSPDFGWLPAKVISTDGTSNQVKVSVKDYQDDTTIPACEVSTILAPPSPNRRRGARDKKMADIELDVDLGEYADKVLPLQNVDS